MPMLYRDPVPEGSGTIRACYFAPVTSYFRTVGRWANIPRTSEGVFLEVDNWDDFGFKTSFRATFISQSGVKVELGSIKIGRVGQEQGSPGIPQEFDKLESSFFSLGQEDGYYETLHGLDAESRRSITVGLRDIVADPSIYNAVQYEPVMTTSLLRSISESTIEGSFTRLLAGSARLSSYKLNYSDDLDLNYEFKVVPDSKPPTNLHVLIGTNGVGKTTLLRRMAESLMGSPVSDADEIPPGKFEVLEDEGNGQFAGIVSVSFSAFDDFSPPATWTEQSRPRYAYIGLKVRAAFGSDSSVRLLSPAETEADFRATVGELQGERRELWLRALRHLESDPIFDEFDVADLGKRITSEDVAAAFRKMSSGHKIVLLTITKLAAEVEEKTLVLIDEPEAHLHPPLLSALVRSLSDMLIQRNGVAIIATHSPVVLQEVPAKCVWIMRRYGAVARPERPLTETFGENVGTLTHEVFGLEVTESGFHTILRDLASSAGNYHDALGRLGGDLGGEGRAILRGLTTGSVTD